jgi:hypothetical protein
MGDGWDWLGLVSKDGIWRFITPKGVVENEVRFSVSVCVISKRNRSKQTYSNLNVLRSSVARCGLESNDRYYKLTALNFIEPYNLAVQRDESGNFV